MIIKNKNIDRVMSGILLNYWFTKEINGEKFEIRFSLMRLKNKNCFRLIHEEFFSKYQDASDLYEVDRKIDVSNIQDAINYLEKFGVDFNKMK